MTDKKEIDITLTFMESMRGPGVSGSMKDAALEFAEKIVRGQKDRIEKLELAIRWALGQSPPGTPEFPRIAEAPYYRWRSTLCKLAELEQSDY